MTHQDPFERTAGQTPQPAPETPPAPGSPQSFSPQDDSPWAQQETPEWARDQFAGQQSPQGSYEQPAAYGALASGDQAQGFGQTGGYGQASGSDYAPVAGQGVGYAQPGSAPQPPYGGQGTPPVPPAPAPYTPSASSATSTDGVSIAALVTGILGLAVVAIVLGAVGMRRTAQGLRKGTWMAVTGLVLGIVATIAWTFYIASMLVASLTILDEAGIEWDTEFSSAMNYGDDPELDALYDQCGAGDGQACDDLYWDSAIGSEYESYAETCGGRGAPTITGYCADE